MYSYEFNRAIETALEIGAVDDVKLISLKQIQSKDGNSNLFFLAVEVRHKKPEPEQKPDCTRCGACDGCRGCSTKDEVNE